MSTTGSFWIGVASSVAATLIVGILAMLWPRTRPWLTNRLLLRLAGVGIDRVYPNREAADSHLLEETRTSTTLKILTNRGVLLAEPAYGATALSGWGRLENAQVLLLDPSSPSAQLRAAEIKALPTTHRTWNLDHFRNDILSVAAKLDSIGHVAVRFHGAPSVFRLVVTDDFAYISGFPKSGLGKDKPVYRVRRGTFLFELFSKYFDQLWALAPDRSAVAATLTKESSASQSVQGAV